MEGMRFSSLLAVVAAVIWLDWDMTRRGDTQRCRLNKTLTQTPINTLLNCKKPCKPSVFSLSFSPFLSLSVFPCIHSFDWLVFWSVNNLFLPPSPLLHPPLSTHLFKSASQTGRTYAIIAAAPENNLTWLCVSMATKPTSVTVPPPSSCLHI